MVFSWERNNKNVKEDYFRGHFSILFFQIAENKFAVQCGEKPLPEQQFLITRESSSRQLTDFKQMIKSPQILLIYVIHVYRVQFIYTACLQEPWPELQDFNPSATIVWLPKTAAMVSEDQNVLAPVGVRETVWFDSRPSQGADPPPLHLGATKADSLHMNK